MAYAGCNSPAIVQAFRGVGVECPHVLEISKSTTQAENRRAIDNFTNPAIGAFQIVDVERKDIAELQHKYRDTPYQANRTLGRAVKDVQSGRSLGIATGRIDPLPTRAELSRGDTRTFSKSERTKTARPNTERGGAGRHEKPVYRGCVLTVDSDRVPYIKSRHIELPDDKVGARPIPLPQAAQDVLDALPR